MFCLCVKHCGFFTPNSLRSTQKINGKLIKVRIKTVIVMIITKKIRLIFCFFFSSLFPIAPLTEGDQQDITSNVF